MGWSSAWRRRAAFAADLDRSDWLALVEAWVRLAGASLSLGRRAGAALEAVPAAAGANGCPCDRATGERLHRLVAAAARFHVARPRCLARAVVLRDMLARRGIPTTIRVGVLRQGSGVSAHAWLEGPAGPFGEHQESLRRFSLLGTSEPPPPSR